MSRTDPDSKVRAARREGVPNLPEPAPPSSESEILAATVGEVQELNSTIRLEPYNCEWPKMFAREAARIRAALRDTVGLLEHVGSTSVPGLSAKPIIDMVMAVPDSRDEASYVPLLEACAYTLRVREPDWFEHRMMKPQEVDGNLHIFSAGCDEIQRMLIFRDWLRRCEDDRRLYEQKKTRLAARTWKYTQNYADSKSAVVREILARALAARKEAE
jgi:GrpB-like predicted nucleotidyltransferase (UPF0157 family)